MSDQMPDEVWCDRRFRNHPNFGDWDCGVDAGHYRSGARYIRADLHEQVKGERDRLRAAIEAALTMGISRDSYALIVSIRRRLQEALDHVG